MKNKVLIILALLFCINLTSCYHAPKHDMSVYITESGQKYHKKNCRYVRNKEIEINLSRALYDKYDPCKVCDPPRKKDLDELNK